MTGISDNQKNLEKLMSELVNNTSKSAVITALTCLITDITLSEKRDKIGIISIIESKIEVIKNEFQ